MDCYTEKTRFTNDTYKAALGSMSAGVLVLNSDAQLEVANLAARQRLGLDNSSDLFAVQKAINEVGLVESAMKSRPGVDRQNDELTFKTPAQDCIIKAKWSRMISDTGKFLGVVINLEDVTANLTEDRAKEQFISMISHELRTPIAIIKNSISNMLAGVTGKISKKTTAYLEKIDSECQRISFLVNNLVDMAKIESGQMPINKHLSDVWQIITDVCNNFMPLATAKNQTLVCETYENIPQVNIDGKRIQQVLWNLVNNAIKFTPEGGRISLKTLVDENNLIFIVEDNGVGISAEQQSVIFNKFYQICRRKGAGYNGSGLGLAISKGIIMAHEGKIWVESEEGIGSKFCISLPMSSRKYDYDFSNDATLYDYDYDMQIAKKEKDLL